MRKNQLLLCALCVTALCYAQSGTSVIRLNTADKVSSLHSLKTKNTTCVRNNSNVSSETEKKHFTLEISDHWFNGKMIIAGENYYESQNLDGYEVKYETDLPIGKYDIILMSARGMMEGGGTAVIVKEDVDIAVTDKIIIGTEDIPLHRVRFRAKLPDGNYMTLKSEPFDDGGGVGKPSYSGQREGGDSDEIPSILMTTFIKHSVYGVIDFMQWEASSIMTGISFDGETPWDFNDEWKGDIYINDVSDKYSFSQIRHVVHPSYGSVITTVAATPSDTDKEWSNVTEDYSEISEPSFSTTPMSEKLGRSTQCYSIETRTVTGDDFGMGSQAIIKNNGWEPRTWLSMPPNGECDEDVAIRFGFADGQEEREIPGWGTFVTVYMIYSPMMMSKAGKMIYHSSHTWYGELIHTSDTGKVKVLPGLDEFSVGEGSPLHPYGKTPAYGWFLNYRTSEYDEEISSIADLDYFDLGFFGIGQDVRNSDEYALEFSCNHNGQNVFHQTGSINYGTMREIRRLGLASGRLEYDFINSNILLEDNMKGTTRVIVSRNLDQEDSYAPMLSMMTIRDTNNDRIDYILDNASDGELILMGTDYDIITAGQGFMAYNYMQPKECIVKAEYAPHGSEDWTELSLKESVPNIESVENCGYLYRASLSSIHTSSENGWYNLRITLTDTSDNTLQEIISPALKIDNVSGVKEILINDFIMENSVVFDCSGACLGKGSEILHTLGKGCYIILDKSTGKTIKIIK